MKQQKNIAICIVVFSIFFAETLSAQLYINNATIIVDTGAILDIKGNVSNAGFIKGAGKAVLSGSSVQTITGIGEINNCKLNNTAGAVIASGAENRQNLFGVLTLTNGTLTTNGNLTLKSNDSGTASIAQIINGGVDGVVTVERWIPATGRRYRLLASAVNSLTTINQNWQEGQMNTAIGTNNNSVSGYGTHITGSGGNANGFDVTASNAPSLYFTTNAQTPTYTAADNTTSNLNALTGYFLFIRGDRSTDINLANTNIPPTPIPLPSGSTTLRTTGTIQTGTISTFTNPFLGGGAFNLITNPYPSTIDWNLVYQSCTNITPYYTLWDPSIGYRGGFVTVKTDGSVSAGSSATKYIQSGQAFFVQSDGGIPTVNIQETHKAIGNNNAVYKTASVQKSISISLFYTEANGYHRLADGVIANFDTSFSASVDNKDAVEINNWDENIAINRNGKHLSIESRPLILQTDTLPLFMNNMKQQSYLFKFRANNFDYTNLSATLIDNFTTSHFPLSITGSTEVPFSVTSSSASSASNRFMVVFSPSIALAGNNIFIKANLKDKGIEVNWSTDIDLEVDHYEIEKSANGNQFSKVASQVSLGNSASLVNYSWFDNNPINGFNYFRIKIVEKAGQVKYSQIVKVKISKEAGTVSLYPNPIDNNYFSLQFNDIPKGLYSVKVTNALGQQVFTTSIQHTGGSSIQNFEIKKNIATGNYQVLVTGNEVNIVIKFIKN